MSFISLVNINSIFSYGGRDRQEKRKEPYAVAGRLLNIFRSYGIEATEIHRFIPEITIDKIRNDDSLLKVLNSDVIDRVSNLLGVRRGWLERGGSNKYDTFFCYQNPEAFLREIKQINIDSHESPMVAFTATNNFDYRKDRKQPVVVILREKIGNLEDRVIYKYRIGGDFWDWGYEKTRVQLKAMARKVSHTYSSQIYIYRVNKKDLNNLREGRVVPRELMRKGKRLNHMYLDDFAETFEENRQAKETDELPYVLKYIDNNFTKK